MCASHTHHASLCAKAIDHYDWHHLRILGAEHVFNPVTAKDFVLEMESFHVSSTSALYVRRKHCQVQLCRVACMKTSVQR